MGQFASGILSGVMKRKFFEVRYEEEAQLSTYDWNTQKWFNTVKNLVCFTEIDPCAANREIHFQSLSKLSKNAVCLLYQELRYYHVQIA